METANLALAASALLAAAEARAESRGCHVRTDHPDRLPSWERSVLVRQVGGVIDRGRRAAAGRRMGLTEETRPAIVDAGLVVDRGRRVIERALAEDLRDGPDVTTLSTVPADQLSRANITPRQAGVLAGGPVAMAVFDTVLGHRGSVDSWWPTAERWCPGSRRWSVAAPDRRRSSPRSGPR